MGENRPENRLEVIKYDATLLQTKHIWQRETLNKQLHLTWSQPIIRLLHNSSGKARCSGPEWVY